MKKTVEDKVAYECPVCGSSNFEYDQNCEPDSATVVDYMVCEDCHNELRATYQLVSMEVL